MERIYFLVSLIVTIIVLSQYQIAYVIMLLILATPSLVFGTYLVHATYTRRKEYGSIAFLTPFLFGLVLIAITIKCLSLIYSLF